MLKMASYLSALTLNLDEGWKPMEVKPSGGLKNMYQRKPYMSQF